MVMSYVLPLHKIHSPQMHRGPSHVLIALLKSLHFKTLNSVGNMLYSTAPSYIRYLFPYVTVLKSTVSTFKLSRRLYGVMCCVYIFDKNVGTSPCSTFCTKYTSFLILTVYCDVHLLARHKS